MIQIVKSLVGSNNEELYNELLIIMSDDNKKTLSADEIDVFTHLCREFNVNKQFPTEEVFLLKFPQYRQQLADTTAFNVIDLRSYRKQFITRHHNIYTSKIIHKIASDVVVEGVTPEMAEMIRQHVSFEDTEPETKLSFRDKYTKSIKENTGLKTYIDQIDDEIGSIAKGSVCTIAGFTGSFKCVSENELIYTNRGLLPIKEIYNIGINSDLEVQSEYGFRKLVAVHDEGAKDSYIISIGGIPIETSPVHKFRVLTNNGNLEWKEARNLNIGDKVVQSLKESYHKGNDDDKDFWRLYGMFYNNGGCKDNLLYLYSTLNKTELLSIEELFSKYFNEYTKKVYLNNENDTAQINLYANKDYLIRKELIKFNKNEFPKNIYLLNSECWKSFIFGFYETNSCFYNHKLCFTYSSKSFLLSLSRLLSCLGISTTLNKENNTYYLNIVDNKSKNKFLEIIKQQSINFNNYNDYEKDFYELKATNISKSFDNISFINKDCIKEIIDAELTWNEITNIKQSHCYMYDLTVDGSPTYLLNGYITHNTTWAVNIAVKNALQGKNIAYISLEVTKEQLEYSIMSLFSNDKRFSNLGYNPLEHQKIRQNKLDADEINFLCDVLEPEYRKVIEPNLHILDESYFKTFSESEILDALIQLDDQKPLDAVFFDHAGLFAFKSPLYNSGNIGVAINKYVSFIRQMSICFRKKDGETRSLASVILAQTNRSGYKEASRQFKRANDISRPGDKNKNFNNIVEGYQLTALSDANELERCSSVVLFVYSNDELKMSHQAYVQMSKTRYGSNVLPIRVDVDAPYYKFGGDAQVDESELSIDLIDSLSTSSINTGAAGTNIIVDDDDIFGL